MFRSVIAATILAATVAFLLSARAAAKGPFSAVLSGGDLAEPITIEGPIDEGGVFGPEIGPPLPFPNVIYTVEFLTIDEGRSAGTISYYPAHDGVPAAWRTSYGFFSVPDKFNDTFVTYFPDKDGSGTSVRWYLLPGIGLGLFVVAGGFGGRRFLSGRNA